MKTKLHEDMDIIINSLSNKLADEDIDCKLNNCVFSIHTNRLYICFNILRYHKEHFSEADNVICSAEFDDIGAGNIGAGFDFDENDDRVKIIKHLHNVWFNIAEEVSRKLICNI